VILLVLIIVFPVLFMRDLQGMWREVVLRDRARTLEDRVVIVT
jgi:hypothetical protein